MEAFLSTFDLFPYLGMSLLTLAVLAAALAQFPGQRRTACLSGLLAAPTALLSVAWVPEYWKPNLVGTPGRVGLEDFFTGFALGGLAWLAAAGPFRRRLRLAPHLTTAAWRYLGVFTLSSAGGLLLWLAGTKVLVACLVSMATTGFTLLCLRRALWPIAVAGALIFPALYVVLLKVTFTLWPHFPSQWTTGNLCGLALGGIPLEELLWAVATGAVWPTVVGYVLEVQVATADRKEKNAHGRTGEVWPMPEKFAATSPLRPISSAKL